MKEGRVFEKLIRIHILSQILKVSSIRIYIQYILRSDKTLFRKWMYKNLYEFKGLVILHEKSIEILN